jgi:tripartite-type tricarboxylate transporter receptor subunit TctC
MKALLATLLLAASGTVAAQAYPARAITLVNGFPPGGGPDIMARQLAAVVSKRIGQQMIVENRPGASGTIGAGTVARAAPDGYTLLFGVASNLAVGPATLKDITYDPVTSFTPVVEIARGPYVLTVSTKLPVNTLGELVDYAKKNPGKLNFASVGPGSPHHFAGELFKKEAGIDMVHVPYKGGGPAYAGFLAGEVQVLFDSMPGPQAHIQAGTVKPIAATGARRIAVLPDVPTFAELGLPGVEINFMFGVVAPAGTPRDVVTKLNAEFTQAMADPEVRQTFARQAVEASPGTPEAFGALVAAEARRWKDIVAKTGFKAN